MELFDFLNNSTNEYLACYNICQILENEGFVRLNQGDKWNLKNNTNYYVVQDQSSVIAFKMGSKIDSTAFNIVASHLDSPNFKIKTNGVIAQNKFTQLDTAVYGGPILQSWFDRPLSICGRVVVDEDGKLVSKIVDAKRDLLVIPNVAIHLKKDVTLNPSKDLIPLASLTKYNDIKDLIEDIYEIKKEYIKGFDLCVYNREEAKTIGVKNEMFMSPRIDNLECAFTTLKGFLESKNDDTINVYCAFNNEEVGSNTKQGADSTFLYDTLKRIIKDEEEYLMTLSRSFMVSADNAHAMHPNHPECYDGINAVYMNEGVVIKHNPNQLYTTDAVSEAYFASICEKAGVPYQHYANRSDIRGGSTLGAISITHVSIPSVDIGLAQLAMHSASETAGMQDAIYMQKAIKAFFEAKFNVEKSANALIK